MKLSKALNLVAKYDAGQNVIVYKKGTRPLDEYIYNGDVMSVISEALADVPALIEWDNEVSMTTIINIVAKKVPDCLLARKVTALGAASTVFGRDSVLIQIEGRVINKK